MLRSLRSGQHETVCLRRTSLTGFASHPQKGFKQLRSNWTQPKVTVAPRKVTIFQALKERNVTFFPPLIVWVALTKVSKYLSEFLDAMWVKWQFNNEGCVSLVASNYFLYNKWLFVLFLDLTSQLLLKDTVTVSSESCSWGSWWLIQGAVAISHIIYIQWLCDFRCDS